MYIGLDIGTSGTKAALVTGEGEILKSRQVSYGFSRVENGLRELDPARVWDAVLECLRAVGGGEDAESVTVSALGEAVVPVDREGAALCDAIAGTDIRGGGQLRDLTLRVGRERLVEITGLNVSSIYSANKILWLRQEQRELFDRAWKFFTFQDFCIWRLSGTAAIDYSMASRTMLFDCRKKEWSEEVLKASGLSEELLSSPVKPGSIVGSMRKDLREELGMRGNVLVVAGTHDHICNAIGSGVCRPGWCSDTAGTTEGVTAVLGPEGLKPREIEECQISCEPFAVDGLYNTVAWENASGVLLRWFAGRFAGEGGERDRMDIAQVFGRLNESMEEKPTGLLVLPHFSGAATPYMDEESKGAILGLTLATTREEIYKAIMEGINLELMLILESVERAGTDVKRIVATGGSLSKQLLQIKADILGREIMSVRSRQTGALGGAVLGAVALGAYKTIEEAVSNMTRFGETYEPDPKKQELYREKLELYRLLYPALRDIQKKIQR